MTKKNQQIASAAAVFALVAGVYMYTSMNPGMFSSVRAKHAAAKVHNFKIDLPRFAGVETLRNVKSPELIAEIEEVIKQNGLPADIFIDDGAQATNIAVTLLNQFHEYDPKNPDDPLQKLWEASPFNEWDVNKQALDSVRTTLAHFETTRQAVRSMLEKSETRFYYIFIRPESLNSLFDVETTVNTEASRYLADYALLEEYAIAQALLDGRIRDATDSLAYIFRITQLASHLANVGVRCDAALVRMRAFDVMQRVVLDPKFDKDQMIYLRNMLSEQRENWVPENTAWFGDRASGLALYHRVVWFGPDDVLEEAQLDELKARGVLEAFKKSFKKYHEADNVFYLQSMQKILDVSREPFLMRQDVLNQIQEELRAREHSYDSNDLATEPFMANLLLKDIDRLMLIFAQDQAALDRALVLTLVSLGQSNTSRYRNPFTGEPYEIQKADGFLSIPIPALPRPFRVPNFTDNR